MKLKLPGVKWKMGQVCNKQKKLSFHKKMAVHKKTGQVYYDA